MTHEAMRAALGGMIVLIVPAFLVCVGAVVMVYRRRNDSVEDDGPR